MNLRYTSGGLLALTIIFLAACSPSTAAVTGPAGSGSTVAGSPSTAEGGSTQTSEGGEVTVVVRWDGPAAGAAFDVKLDTHSVDLAGLDLSNALLRNDRGEVLSAQPWAAPGGEHHREGTLTFAGDATRFLSGARWVELVLTGIGETAQRTLRWTIAA